MAGGCVSGHFLGGQWGFHRLGGHAFGGTLQTHKKNFLDTKRRELKIKHVKFENRMTNND